jgi:hypothetical protein
MAGQKGIEIGVSVDITSGFFIAVVIILFRIPLKSIATNIFLFI